MSLSLEGMKHMLLCFSPFVGNSKSLAEFARRIQSKKVKETNPNMEVTLKPRLNVMPFIEVRGLGCFLGKQVHQPLANTAQISYESGEKQVILTSARTIDDIVKLIQARAHSKQMEELYKEAGWDNLFIESTWGRLPKHQRGKLLGYSVHAPRDEEEPGPND